MQLQSFNFEEIKPHLYNFIKDTVKEVIEKENNKKQEFSNYELMERIVKVEEELKHQRELIHLILKQMDKRFEQIDKKFEQITARIDRFMFWSLGLVLSSTMLIIGYMHYFIK